MTPIFFTRVDSPLQPILLVSDGTALTGLYLADGRHGPSVDDTWRRDDDAAPFARARAQLAAYFAGERTDFDLPLAAAGTAFQRQVWEELRTIPYGKTLSYGALARQIGQPGASRAVGLANGRNPLSILVPCHRVLGANGALTGYGGGLHRKAALLAFEAAVVAHGPRPFPVSATPVLDL